MAVFFVHEPSRGIVTPLADKYRIRQILDPDEMNEIQKTHRKLTPTPENYQQPQEGEEHSEAERENQIAATAYSETRDQATEQQALTPAGSIMSKPVITIPISSSLSDAWRLMRHHSISHLLITDEKNQLAGLLSEKNILPYLFEAATPDRDVTLEMFCQRTLLSATPDTDIYEIAQVMLENRLDGVVIIENNTLQGIITYSDIVKVLLKTQQVEEFA
ncbi:CBS domain-containing protein [Alkalimarinus coralli]|uniref:CBS domain-containing protein n=1 Tax=Alkalimarinus coralli TaxID=2935863 RepID=UPI00202B5DEB|nr:CBS domain-containing protein [Alkalimarinus coralli]